MTGEVLQTLWFFVPAYLANMAPVVAQGHFDWLDRPLDGGRTWRGTRIFGAHRASDITALTTFAHGTFCTGA